MPATPDERVKGMLRSFVRKYQDGWWSSAVLRWPDEEEDGGVDCLATRPDGSSLAIEHTLVEPFEGNRTEFERLRHFLHPLLEQGTLREPGVATYINVSREALQCGVLWAEAAKQLLEWAIAHVGRVPVDGKTSRHRVDWARGGFYITVRRQSISAPRGHFIVRRFGAQEVAKVVATAVRRKVGKLSKQEADRRVLLLERTDWQLDECEIVAEVRKHLGAAVGLETIDDTWIVETNFSGDSSANVEDFIDFKLYDENLLIVRSFSFLGSLLFDESTDGVPTVAPRVTAE